MTENTVTEATRRLLRINQSGQHVWFSADILEPFGDLIADRVRGVPEADHGHDTQREPESLLISPHGHLIPNAGCLPAVRRLAERANYTIDVVTSPGIVRLPAPVNRDQMQYPPLAPYVCQHERGLIRIPPGMKPAQLVIDLVMAYPGRRLVVLGSKLAELEELGSSIRNILPPSVHGQVRVTHSRRPLRLGVDEPSPPLIFSTYAEAYYTAISTADIVLLLNAEHGVHESAYKALGDAMDARFRLFGVIRSQTRPAPFAAARMMAVFGPELLELMTSRRTRRDINVTWVQHRQPAVSPTPEGKPCPYKCYWHNERRNRVVGQVARALVEGTALPGAVKCDDLAAWQSARNGQPQAVAILVDSPEHALALGKKLRDWPVISTEDVDLHGFPGSLRTRLARDRQRGGEGRRHIVLVDAARTFPGYRCDVVIWAGGGPGADAIPLHWLGQLGDACHPLLIVDFEDRFTSQTSRWSEQRRRHYAEQDVFGVGVTAATGRNLRFLAQHHQRVHHDQR